MVPAGSELAAKARCRGVGMFVLSIVFIHLLAFGEVAISLYRAPIGYEDELGFHLKQLTN